MTSPSEVFCWSTRSVPVAQRFDYFADALASSLLPMSVSAPDPSAFELDIAATDIGPLSIALIEGSAHRALRSASELQRSAAHTFHLVIALAAPCQLQHRGTNIALKTGDITFVDSRYGHDFALGQGQRNLNLTLPADWVRQWLPNPQVLVGRALPRESGWVRALTCFASGLTPDFLVQSPLPYSMLADHLGGLLALTASEFQRPESPVRPVDRPLVDLVRDCVRQRAAECSLTAEDVARSMNVSPRTLHRKLAAAGETFGSLLIGARVELAVRMLESPLLNRLSIEQIGSRAGFVDASHFARVLRSRTGRTPSQLRRNKPTA